jgi:hypothetical protein
MKSKKSLGLIVFAFAAALAAVPLMQSSPTYAAKVSGKVKFKVNGKGFSSFKRATAATYTTSPTILSVIANTKPSRKGIRSFTFSVNADLANATLPLTVPAFFSVYSESSLAGVGETWAGEGITVTIQKIKRNLVKGTLEGTLPAGATGSGGGPATFEKGKFKVKLLTPIS